MFYSFDIYTKFVILKFYFKSPDFNKNEKSILSQNLRNQQENNDTS